MTGVYRRTQVWLLLASVSLCVALAACALAETTGKEATGTEPAPSTEAARAEDGWRESSSDGPRIVALGDSLTAGLGLSPEESYPARLQERLESAGHRLRVMNAGVSGDTTAGGLRRLAWALEGDVRVLIVALGGNDGLRGLPVDQMKDNLSRIIAAATARGVKVLLAGMEAPPNFGVHYTDWFRQVYSELDAEHEVVFVPFLLEGVAGVPELNQPDGIHPNAEGADRVAAHVWSALESMLPAAVDAVH